MHIKRIQEVINAFNERFVPLYSEKGEFTAIKPKEDGKVAFIFNNDYEIIAWITDNQLHLESDMGESLYDAAEYYGWSERDIQYIKFGIKPSGADRIVGNLLFWQNGSNGFSFQRNYTDSITGIVKNDYNGISGNDLLDYTFHELIPYDFDKIFSEEEKKAFIEEYNKAKASAKYHY